MTTRPAVLAGGVLVVAAAAGLLTTQPWSSGSAVIHGHGAQVLGEKLSASGTGGNTASPSGTSGSGGKGFTISGTVDGLFPGSSVNLGLTVANPNSQAINVTALSATLDHIDKAAGAPSGDCTSVTSGVVIHSWTGTAFTVAKNASASAPGVIPVEMQPQSAGSCEGAMFWFSYHGSATSTKVGDATCNGTLPAGAYHNVTANSGCKIDSTVSIEGNLTVTTGGSLLDSGAQIAGDLQANKAAWVAVDGGSVGGNLQVTGTSSRPGTSADGANYLCNVTVGNDVVVQSSLAGAPFDIGGGPACRSSLTVGGNLQVQSNAAQLTIGGGGATNPSTPAYSNVVSGNIQVGSNTGSASSTLTNNKTSSNCQLSGDNPGITGSGNVTPAKKTNTCNRTA